MCYYVVQEVRPMGVRKLVRQLRHGQVTIPKEFREALGLERDDLLAVELRDGKLQLEPVKVAPTAPKSAWARELYDAFAPARESLREERPEDVDEAIDRAVREARRSRP
jgi:AbrB family looped-hinge helix DNA binding protein